MEELKIFIKTLMLEAGFKPEQLFDDIVDDALEILIDRITTEIMIKLNESDRDIFVELANNNADFDPAFEFAQMKIKDFDVFLKEKLIEFRLEYLESFSK